MLIKSEFTKGISWVFLSSIIDNILRFLLVFIIVRCYSKAEFGLWATITSLAAVIVTGDFGFTNVLRNIASKGIANKSAGEKITIDYYYSAFIFLLLVAIIFTTFLLCFYKCIPFESLFKTNSHWLKLQGRNICSVVLSIFLYNLPLTLVSGMYFSYGMNKESSVFSIANSFTTFVIITIMACSKIRIDFVAISYFLISLFVNLVKTIYFLLKRRWIRQIEISIHGFIYNIRIMFSMGVRFLFIGFATTFIYNSLTIYAGSILGLEIAANINVAQKIFTFFVTIFQNALNPIWSKLSYLYYSEEFSKCKALLKFSVIGTLLLSLFIICFVTILSDFLVHIVAGVNYYSDKIIFVLIGCCLFAKLVFDNTALLLTSLNKLGVILIGYGLFSLIAFFLFPKIIIIYGFNQMMLVMIVCWLIFSLAVIFETRHVFYK